MAVVRKSSVEPQLVESIVRGYDAQAVFERDGVLDRLRAALIEKFAGQRPINLVSQPIAAGNGAPLAVRIFDLRDRVVALHARGHSVDDIQRRASMLVGETIPLQAIEEIVRDVQSEARAWQSRALEVSYPIIVFERFRVKWREAASVYAKPCYFAIGFQARGAKEVLGLWFEEGDPPDFWRIVFSDLRDRGVLDALYIVSSGGEGIDAAAEAFAPVAVVRNPCELIRQSLDLATTKDRAAVQKALRSVHSAADEGEARESLDRFDGGVLGRRYPAIGPMWRRHWRDVAVPFFQIPTEVRRVMTSIYAADSLRRGFQRTIRIRGHMTSKQEAADWMYLAVREALGKWRRPQREWHAAKTRLAVLFPDRFVP